MQKLYTNQVIKFGNIEILPSSCNPTTVMDGRGGIFSWVPTDAIKEFNLLYFRPNKVRGNHYHPEFVEYFLVVDGCGAMITKDPKDGSDMVLQMSEGTCVRIPKNTPHAFQAITAAKCISLLTKPWDDCDPPIVFENIIPMDAEYVQYIKEKNGHKNINKPAPKALAKK